VAENETLPDFGYVVEPRHLRGILAETSWAVVWLDAEFGDSTLCICPTEDKAKMVCDAMNQHNKAAGK
jgi:hypothetical protein